MMEYQKFCYRYVAQPSLINMISFVFVLSSHFSQNYKFPMLGSILDEAALFYCGTSWVFHIIILQCKQYLQQRPGTQVCNIVELSVVLVQPIFHSEPSPALSDIIVIKNNQYTFTPNLILLILQ